VDLLNRDKEKVAMVHFTDVWPLNEKYFDFLDKARFCAVVENNFTGQFGRLIARASGRVIANRINKYNGLPFFAREIVGAYRNLKKSAKKR